MPVDMVPEIRPGVLLALPDFHGPLYVGTLSNPDSAALTAAWFVASGRVVALGDHLSYYNSGDSKYYFLVFVTDWHIVAAT